MLRLGQRVALFETAKTTQEEVVHAITAGTLAHVPGMADAASGGMTTERRRGVGGRGGRRACRPPS